MNDVIITWNVTNWITVVLMVFIAFGVLGAVSRMMQSKGAENA